MMSIIFQLQIGIEIQTLISCKIAICIEKKKKVIQSTLNLNK